MALSGARRRTGLAAAPKVHGARPWRNQPGVAFTAAPAGGVGAVASGFAGGAVEETGGAFAGGSTAIGSALRAGPASGERACMSRKKVPRVSVEAAARAISR